MLLGKTKHKIKELETDDGIIILKKKKSIMNWNIRQHNHDQTNKCGQSCNLKQHKQTIKIKISESTGLTFRIQT